MKKLKIVKLLLRILFCVYEVVHPTHPQPQEGVDQTKEECIYCAYVLGEAVVRCVNYTQRR